MHRNSTIARDETQNIKIQPPNNSEKSEIISDILNKLKSLGEDAGTVLKKVNEEFTQRKHNEGDPVIDMKGRHYSKPTVNYNDYVDQARRRRRRDLILSTASEMNRDDEEHDQGIEENYRFCQ
ncbi:hypothetical protein NQ318_009973 [Aromia moschata]|uniref:Uncharacterized protein n=1 Tax=Aromia moschata TaxID=1265417 RepID=A0AAV8Y9B4_9CUCU|nr:hypothetical protein NQ318_009973 [Aromia moschata]